MFKMIKTPDPGCKFHNMLVHLSIDNNELDMTEMVQMFRDFLRACGYHEDTISEYLGEPE
jgi:hypothetical protein